MDRHVDEAESILAALSLGTRNVVDALMSRTFTVPGGETLPGGATGVPVDRGAGSGTGPDVYPLDTPARDPDTARRLAASASDPADLASDDLADFQHASSADVYEGTGDIGRYTRLAWGYWQTHDPSGIRIAGPLEYQPHELTIPPIYRVGRQPPPSEFRWMHTQGRSVRVR
jgi:hypothetical protein